MGCKVLVFILLLSTIATSSVDVKPSSYCRCSEVHKFYTCFGVKFASQEIVLDVEEEVNYCASVLFRECDFNTIPKNAFRMLKSMSVFDVHGCNLTKLFKSSFEGGAGTSALFMDDNNIESIPGGVFEYVSNLRQLSLSRNKISTLELYCFLGLGTLEILRLNANRIRFVPEHIFQPLTNLGSIDLSSNGMEYLPDRVFAHNSKLFYIYLRNNKLKILDQKTPMSVTSLAFLCPTGVEYIDLRGNYMPYISRGTFSELTDLEQLYIDSMNISHIEDGALDSLEKLKSLSLAHNQLIAFNVSLLKHLRRNEYTIVDLSDNLLTSLDYKRLPNGSSLSLAGNPWTCSYLLEMKEYFLSSRISTDLFSSSCSNATQATTGDDLKHQTNVWTWILCSLAATIIVIVALGLFFVTRQTGHYSLT